MPTPIHAQCRSLCWDAHHGPSPPHEGTCCPKICLRKPLQAGVGQKLRGIFYRGYLSQKGCEFVLVSLREGLGSGAGGWWGVVFPCGKRQGKGEGGRVGGGWRGHKQKESARQCACICQNYTLANYPCNPKVLGESPKMVKSQKWLGEGAQGLLSVGSENGLAPGQNGVAPVQNGFGWCKRLLGDFCYLGLKVPFAPSPNHSWEFTIFGLSPRTFGSQHYPLVSPRRRCWNTVVLKTVFSQIAMIMIQFGLPGPRPEDLPFEFGWEKEILSTIGKRLVTVHKFLWENYPLTQKYYLRQIILK